LKRVDGRSARAASVHNELAPGNTIEQRGKLATSDIRSGQVELVISTVKASVSNKENNDLVTRLCFCRDPLQGRLQGRFCRPSSGQRSDLNVRSRGLQQLLSFSSL